MSDVARSSCVSADDSGVDGPTASALVGEVVQLPAHAKAKRKRTTPNTAALTLPFSPPNLIGFDLGLIRFAPWRHSLSLYVAFGRAGPKRKADAAVRNRR